MKDVQTVFLKLKGQFLALIPDLLASLLVLVIGYLVAISLKYIVALLFRNLGKLTRRRFQHLNLEKAGLFLGIAFFWLTIFASILIVTDILGLTILAKWFQSIIHYIPNVVVAVFIVFAATVFGSLISDLIPSVEQRTGIKYSATLIRIVRFVILFLAIIIALDQIGIEISLLIDIIDIILASLLFGAALAFGLGAKEAINNILASYYIRKRYKEGDEIQIDDVRGVILKIEATNVIIDNEIGQVSIPAKIFNNPSPT